MEIDSINNDGNKFNYYIKQILIGLNLLFEDPVKLIKYRLTQTNKLKEFKHMIRILRETGRDRILERIKAFKNDEPLPNDILTSILTNYSK